MIWGLTKIASENNSQQDLELVRVQTERAMSSGKCISRFNNTNTISFSRTQGCNRRLDIQKVLSRHSNQVTPPQSLYVAPNHYTQLPDVNSFFVLIYALLADTMLEHTNDQRHCIQIRKPLITELVTIPRKPESSSNFPCGKLTYHS